MDPPLRIFPQRNIEKMRGVSAYRFGAPEHFMDPGERAKGRQALGLQLENAAEHRGFFVGQIGVYTCRHVTDAWVSSRGTSSSFSASSCASGPPAFDC